jgi:3-deoxy-D-manno-octulosonate 8-phosphate phosphatase (KDO 8-P phosphatase)
MKNKITTKAAKIKLLVLDVDGVLTNGQIFYGDNGEQTKGFYVPDGMGMKMLLRAGIEIAVISGKFSLATRKRLEELGVTNIFLGYENKREIFAKLIASLAIPANAIAYIGDDLPDLPLMEQVALSCAVKNAHPKVQKQADYVTDAVGGFGAVREVCELILSAQDELQKQEQFYF